MSQVYNVIGQKDKASAFFPQALPIRRQVKDLRGEAVNPTNIAVIYQSRRQLEQALKFPNLAPTIAQKIDDRLGEANTLNNIGSVYDELHQPQASKVLIT